MGMEVETVEKDLDGLEEDAQRAAIQRDAPELEALLGELRHNLAEVRGRIGPLIKEVCSGVKQYSSVRLHCGMQILRDDNISRYDFQPFSSGRKWFHTQWH